eukprot:1534824-Prymnesium_polylepis.2
MCASLRRTTPPRSIGCFGGVVRRSEAHMTGKRSGKAAVLDPRFGVFILRCGRVGTRDCGSARCEQVFVWALWHGRIEGACALLPRRGRGLHAR